ncbi:MAG: Ycf51 family protein [Scytonema sp. PMC 1069.18]|nr:Ycf51 family protein [Scytonema sp. PMC 1069.18]MEC4887019.1 Ycf51 family protein [Scytonema sp. PMC 1070.18]
MFTTDDFFQYTQWSGIATLVFAGVTILGFLFKWGIRFRLVGATGFMLVLTGGLFALSLAPLTRTVIPGAVRYSRVYDNGATQAVITIPNEITPSELDATLRQAASDLYSYGRLGTSGNNQLTIRARTVIHPEPGVSVPLYLGQVKRSLAQREDSQMAIDIYQDKFAQLAPSKA